LSNRKIAVIGLGYVGLPVACEFARKLPTVGFDINSKRVEELRQGYDRTKECTQEELKNTNLILSDDIEAARESDFYIIAVPTPIDEAKQPDFAPLEGASNLVGKVISKGDIVVFESTVYPGATEEVCLPILEEVSGLKAGVDFKLGYSPERINPGDREHSFRKIKKVVSASDNESLEIVANTYAAVVEAGVHKASSIKVAEAAKVIENTQRDLNIALMNELSMICQKLGIDTYDVLEAAGTKWNFLKFFPGLVGGHCIGVDPYYLTHKAEKIGFHPQVILSGRQINDSMGPYVAQELMASLVAQGKSIKGQKVTIFGATFKENCPDLRNSKVQDVFKELNRFGLEVSICDPVADLEELKSLYGKSAKSWDEIPQASAVVVAVSHNEFKDLDFEKYLENNGVVMDIRAIYDREKLKSCGYKVWRP